MYYISRTVVFPNHIGRRCRFRSRRDIHFAVNELIFHSYCCAAHETTRNL